MIRFLGWEAIAKIKTKGSTPISILRGTLLRHAIQSIDQIDDEEIKKNILREEMNWLNQYWAQPVPKKDLPSKYWQRLYRMKSLDVRRDYYE